jgi:hypothetical protein
MNLKKIGLVITVLALTNVAAQASWEDTLKNETQKVENEGEKLEHVGEGMEAVGQVSQTVENA